MEETRLRQLYQRFNERTASDTEVEEFYLALSDPAVEQVIKSIIGDTWDMMSPPYSAEVPDDKAMKIFREIIAEKPQVVKTPKLWPRVAVAAATLAAITLGTWLYRDAILSKDNPAVAISKGYDIAPGKQGATITMANGKVIQLSDAQSGVVIQEDLKYTDGSEIASIPGNDAMEMTAATAKGQTYQITLPDGTKVWLNAASSIRFPSQFSGLERKISLDGEAYFEVAKDKAKHFIVESKGQSVEVLGTHFNINSYVNEGSLKTTLLEGSVRVSIDGDAEKEVVLKTNQQAINTGNTINVKEVDPELSIAWKNKQFLFESEDIQSIMRMVERWYNVEVVYSGALTKDTFSGGVSRFDNLSEVLKSLESTGKVRFKIEGRRVVVTK